MGPENRAHANSIGQSAIDRIAAYKDKHPGTFICVTRAPDGVLKFEVSEPGQPARTYDDISEMFSALGWSWTMVM